MKEMGRGVSSSFFFFPSFSLVLSLLHGFFFWFSLPLSPPILFYFCSLSCFPSSSLSRLLLPSFSSLLTVSSSPFFSVCFSSLFFFFWLSPFAFFFFPSFSSPYPNSLSFLFPCFKPWNMYVWGTPCPPL